MPRSLISDLMMPTEGFCSTPIPRLDHVAVRTYLPTGYEPNYAYPLIVLLHGHGGSDEQAIRYAPRISRRNHIFISLRGPMPLEERDDDGLPAYTWGEPGAFDSFVENYVVRAIEQTRREYHVHSERVYLAGIAEGATVAYRLALNNPERFAGLIALNGRMPRTNDGTVARGDELRRLRILMAHGAANEVVPLEIARRDFLALYGAGIDVSLVSYPASHKIHPNMLRDINRWVIRNVHADSCYTYRNEEDDE